MQQKKTYFLSLAIALLLATKMPAIAAAQKVKLPPASQQEVDPFGLLPLQAAETDQTGEAKKKAEENVTKNPTEQTPTAPVPDPKSASPESVANKAKVHPQLVTLHLLDGNILSGIADVKEIEVETEFGALRIPIHRIRAFRPGLNTYTQLRKKLDELVLDLGANEYTVREKAHKDLSAYGLRILSVVDEFKAGNNPERKRHLDEIKKELQELESELDEDEELNFGDRPLIEGDEIVTDTFTVIGKIKVDDFRIKSRYGNLVISIKDISYGDRPLTSLPDINKTVTVKGSDMAQSRFKSTGIKVRAGDVVLIKADGQIVMSPWGDSEMSGPNGATNYGWFRSGEIEAGALVARIGNSGKIFKLGTKKKFTCKTSGTLNFAIGMNPEYASGYNYPGEYKVKVKVQPKG